MDPGTLRYSEIEVGSFQVGGRSRTTLYHDNDSAIQRARRIQNAFGCKEMIMFEETNAQDLIFTLHNIFYIYQNIMKSLTHTYTFFIVIDPLK